MVKFKYIDSLRGWAILAVLLNHNLNLGDYHYNGKIPTIFLHFFQTGGAGVQLFFIISSFTLWHSLDTRKNEETSPIKNYFVRRFFRIAPLFYLAIIYYLWQDGLGARYWLGDQKEITIFNIISDFTFTFGFNPYWLMSIVPYSWTIAVESLFYIILPYLFLKIKNINDAIRVTMVIYILTSVLVFFLAKYPLINDKDLWHSYLLYFFPSQFYIFLLGSVIYFIVFKNDRISPQTILLSALFIILLYISHAVNLQMIKIDLILILSIGFAFLICALHYYPVKFIVNDITAFIGKISFSIYLSHDAVAHFMKVYHLDNLIITTHKYGPLADYFLRLILFSAFTIAISTLLYYTVEKAGQQLGRIIIRRNNNKFSPVNRV